MEYTSLKELYQNLLPVFSVKQRMLKYYKYQPVTNSDIFKYLTITKWKHSHDLSIYEVVNDIMNVDVENIIKLKGTKQ